MSKKEWRNTWKHRNKLFYHKQCVAYVTSFVTATTHCHTCLDLNVQSHFTDANVFVLHVLVTLFVALQHIEVLLFFQLSQPRRSNISAKQCHRSHSDVHCVFDFMQTMHIHKVSTVMIATVMTIMIFLECCYCQIFDNYY